MVTSPHNEFDAVSLDLSKAPNYIYIDHFNDETFQDRLVDLGFKIVEVFLDTCFYFVNVLSGNKKLLFLFFFFNFIFHFYAGKF